MLDLRQFGAIYGDSSPEAIAQNNRAIRKCLSAVPFLGESVQLQPGTLHYSDTIVYPSVWIDAGASAYRAQNFGIYGACGSYLHYHGSGFAIKIEPVYPVHYPIDHCVLALHGVQILGGGLEVLGGGKMLSLADVVIGNAPLGLMMRHFDGGSVRNLYIHGCDVGAAIESSQLLQCLPLTIRRCKHHGLVARKCGAWTGQLYVEANEGTWQADLDGCRYWNTHLWAEDHTGMGDRRLVRMRNCLDMVFSGNTRYGRFLDLDAVSRATLRLTNSMPLSGDIVGETPTRIDGYHPGLKGEGLTLIAEPGCLGKGYAPQAELKPIDPTKSIEYAVNDLCQFECTVTVDQQTLDWCGDKWILKVLAAGGTTDLGQTVRLDGITTHVRGQVLSPNAGVGMRMFVYLLGPDANDVELRFTIGDWVMTRLRNQ